MMARVFLHGHLGEKYGRQFSLAVHSAAEACALLAANFKGFTADMLAHRHGYFFKIDGNSVENIAGLREKHIAPEIHIVPVLSGAGGDNKGGGLIAIAAVIAIAAYTGYIPTEYVNFAYGVAANLAMSGVNQMLMAGTVQPEGGNDELTGETNKASYAFSGPVNTVKQGNPVPVLYGRLLVGSQIISAGVVSV